MPRTEELPPGLHALARRQALKLSHEDFVAQTNRLIEEVAPLLPWAPRTSKKVGTPAPEDRPKVTVLSKSADDLTLCLFLNETHRFDISIDGIRVDGKRVRGEKFLIQDGDRSIPGSCLLSKKEVSYLGQRCTILHKVILVVDGAVVYDKV